MKYVLIILLVVLIVENAKSCDCPEVKRDSLVYSGLLNSKIVFLGELLSSNEINGTFKYKILELFKGQSIKGIVQGKISNNCSLFPTARGLWIVYADYNEDSTLDLSICAESIPLNKAEGQYPPPPPTQNLNSDIDKAIDSLKDDIYILKLRTEGLSHWYKDLYILREYKKAKMDLSEKKDRKNIFITSLIIFNILLIAILVFKRR